MNSLKTGKILLGLFLLLPSLGICFNLGFVPKSNYQTVERGESTQFTILFWNIGDNKYDVKIQPKNIPEKWKILITPSSFSLEDIKISQPPYEEGEYISIPEKGYVKAKEIRVFIKVSDDTAPGKYDIFFDVLAGDQKEQISVIQGREFKLTIEVVGQEKVVKKVEKALKLVGDKINQETIRMKKGITGLSIKVYPRTIGLILILSLISIILVFLAVRFLKK